MSISRISINEYKEKYGETPEEQRKFLNILPQIIREQLKSLDVEILDVYNLKEEKHSYKAGRAKQRLVVFGNATMEGFNETLMLEHPEKINGIENSFTRFLSPTDKGIIITSENGTPLAEWHEKTWELNILFNIFKKYDTQSIEIFKYILKEFERLVWFPKTMENSWKYTQNKEKLTSIFSDTIKRNKEALLKEDIRRVAGWENDLNNYRRNIKQISDNLFQKRRQVIQEQESIKNISEGFIKDLDLIINSAKIEDLHIKDGIFEVYTAPLYIYSDKGKRYYGGKYKIELNPDNSDVHFFGDNPRRGFWTDQDPHPHVNGNGGTPCLGNVSSTIAELCSQMQIYALIMICIDFLEAANTADAAGKNVIHWDEVDKDGKVIKDNSGDEDSDEEDEDDEDSQACTFCGDMVHPYNLQTAYDNVEETEDGLIAIDEVYVCPNCLETHYHYDGEVEEYILNQEGE